jgi:hypothetical protein
MSTLVESGNFSDDSSEEDEPIAVNTLSNEATNDDDAAMNDEMMEDEEDEDMVMMRSTEHMAQGKSPRFQKHYEAVQVDPWNVYEWKQLMVEVNKIPSIEEARHFYEMFLEQFPTSVRMTNHTLQMKCLRATQNRNRNDESIYRTDTCMLSCVYS